MKRGDFRIRLLLAVVLPSVLMAATLGLFWWNWTWQILESALRDRVEATAKQLAIASELPLFSGDLQTLQGMVDSIGAGDKDLHGVAIIDPRGGLLVKHGEAGTPSGILPVATHWSQVQNGRHWRWVQPVAPTPLPIDDLDNAGLSQAIGAPAEPLGYVVLDVSLKRLTAVRDNMLMLGAAVIIVAILFSVALMAWLARGVIRPLSRIIKGVEAMGAGHLETRIEADEGDVFLPLVDGINKMAKDVQLTQIDLEHRIAAATLELREAKVKAELEARIDPLTGLYNRRAFLERASDELRRARRYNKPLSLAMIDLDHFKTINDRWGHAIGDQVLVAFAGILKNHMRGVDVVARVGGEEFVMLMTETAYEDAMQVAERIRKDIKANSLQIDNAELSWTASLGVTVLDADEDSVSGALVRADRALYRAKQNGRDRVESDLPDTPGTSGG